MTLFPIDTADSEMFVRTLFSLIFANSSPHEFKVLANIVKTNLKIAILVNRILAH